MHEAVAMEWISELRSGKYKQAAGNLVIFEDGECKGHCCLGVLGRIVGLGDGDMFGHGGLGGKALIRSGLRNGFGAPFDDPDEQGVVIEGTYFSALSEANDEGASFEAIADWIEKNWRVL